MRTSLLLLGLLVFVALAGALDIKSPVQQTITNGETIDVGKIGPGQTLAVQINPSVTTGGILGNGGNYDKAVFVNLPIKWKSEDSKLYQNPLQVTITADENATPGDYYANITVIDEQGGEELGNFTFGIKIKITWDVIDFKVSPASKIVGPGQPAQYQITITNYGAASDAFQISAGGIKKWEFTKAVFLPPKSSRTIVYEISSEEEETYHARLTAISMSSKNINAEQNVTLVVKSDLWGDMKATNHGAVLFPIVETPVYALTGLLAGIIKTIFGG